MTSMVFALRATMRLVVRRSALRSYGTVAPRIAFRHDQARLADFLTGQVVQQVVDDIAVSLPPLPEPPPDRAAKSKQLSVATLLDMMINEKGKYLVHRTSVRAIGELWEGREIDAGYPAGTLDPNAPPGIYAVPGLVGVPYGDWCVIFKKGDPGHYFTSVGVTADAENANKEEMICVRNIRTSAAHGWCTVADVREAKKQYDAHNKKVAGTSAKK
ncbi:hypothetical protein [Lentzea sp. NPDC060358]|uniref:hypothetical protein n=1 Tax=Lentzea sp. NPDC060358 TaxID=3347103 RepID=UPI003665AE47